MRAIHRTALPLATLCASLTCPTLASAQDASTTEPTSSLTLSPAIGARIGGYGFRQLNQSGELDFFNCRMNGTGLFATLDITRHLFTELSADYYHAESSTLASGIDRLSFHTQAAIGARLLPELWISPFIQAGGGAEWTRVEVFGRRDSGVHPVGFMGVGAELNIASFHFGMTVRANAMQLPKYDWRDSVEGQNAVSYETETAGQVLFSMRYTL